MQTVIIYLTLFFTTLILQAQNTFEITILNFDNSKGTVKIGLFDKESNFLKETYKATTSKIKNKKAPIIFTDIPDGIYAISCYHDKDSNGKLNMFMGMFSSESYGSSNNPSTMIGPPAWEEAKFELKSGENRQLIIKM
jgi:uncharacterized protein (DUF2141 family)